jgi:hypothetical protein
MATRAMSAHEHGEHAAEGARACAVDDAGAD